MHLYMHTNVNLCRKCIHVRDTLYIQVYIHVLHMCLCNLSTSENHLQDALIPAGLWRLPRHLRPPTIADDYPNPKLLVHDVHDDTALEHGGQALPQRRRHEPEQIGRITTP